MPSEKAKENKTLTAECSACGKSVSTELIHTVIVRRERRRVAIPVCDACRTKGWQPPERDTGS
jgi:NAD-dependent SIR2 family protein deacetylase